METDNVIFAALVMAVASTDRNIRIFTRSEDQVRLVESLHPSRRPIYPFSSFCRPYPSRAMKIG